MRIEKNRFCRMLLLLVLLAVLLGSVPVFASDANVQIKVGESAISLTSYTGSTWDNFKNKNVYVANVPAGTTAVDICLNYEGSLNRYDDDYDIWSTEISANQWSTQTLSHYPFSSEAFPNITDGTNYYIIACQDSDYLWTDIILVHVGGGAEPEPSLSPEQKKPLSDLLATVADGNNKYYQSGDRYNGKSADTITDQKSGFWAQFTADKGPRANAQKVLETATTEEQINTAVTELKEAIDKLIPASQLNATYLYETLQTYQRSEGDLAQYTKTSGKNFRAARTAAQEYLDSLFDEKGDATAVNTSLNQQTANNKADALKQSWQNILALSKLTDAETNVKMIRALANRYTENKGYDAESWNTLKAARDAALAYIAANPVSDSMTKAQVNGLLDVINAFWNSICSLKPESDSISVTLTFTDDYHLRIPNSKLKDSSGLMPGTNTYQLSKGQTLADLLTKAGYTSPYGGAADGAGADADSNTPDTQHYYEWRVYVNGILQHTDMVADWSSEPRYTAQMLHDGDQVQIVHLDAPTRSVNYIYRETLEWDELTSALGTLRFASGSETSAAAGVPLALTVERAGAHLWSYTGSYSAYEGAELAVYGPKNADGTYPATATLTGSLTDANGVAQLTLYDEGEYLVTAFDPRENDADSAAFYSATVAAPYLTVKVGESSDVSGVKAALKEELDAVYNAYPLEQFSTDAWTKLKAAYDKAIKVLNNADSTVSAAHAAQQTAIETIQKLQNEMLGDNQDALSRFRTYLAMLPDDTAKLTKQESVLEAVNNLKGAYNAMTSYQKSLLTGSEEAKYERIVTFVEENESSLPDGKSYTLTFKVEGDSKESTEILNAMYSYLRENPAKQDRAAGGRMDRPDIQIATPFAFGSYAKDEEAFTQTFESAAPLTKVRIFTGLNSSSYFQTRNAGGSFSPEDAKWSISDANLIYTETLTKNSSTSSGYSVDGYQISGDMIVTIDGVQYELQGITYAGISKSDITTGTYTIYDDGTYKGKDEQAVNMKFDGMYAEFAMPYDDVVITAHWVRAEGLDETKAAAKKSVSAQFASYSESDYTAENWASLVAAKDNGLAAIDAAQNAADVTAARKAAINAMAAIPTTSGGSTGTVGKNYPYKDETPVGRVHVIVENTTYLSDSLPTALKNQFVNGWYDLNPSDSMMTVALKALDGAGYTWNNYTTEYGISYLSSVETTDSVTGDRFTLGEFVGGSGSGWMGTLNDWFTNEGFSNFTAANGKLQSGDEIHIMYTTDLGVDLGGSFTGNDTTLKKLTITGGELSPAFSSSTTEYVLQITDESACAAVSFEAANKNFQSRMYLNNYNNENSRYASGSRLQITSGDIIYVGVGELSWPSMNAGSPPKKYTIRVVKQGNLDDLKAIVARLPDASKLTLADAEDVETAYSLYQALDESQRSDFGSSNYNKLMACVKRMPVLKAIAAVTAAADKLPQNPANLTLADKQTVADAQAALDKLKELGGESEVSSAVRKKISDATAQISKLEVERVESLINALPDSITESDREAVVAARAAYNALTDKQKNAIGSLVYQKLLAAEAALKNQQPDEETNYSEYLRKALANIKKTVPTPTIGSSSGEWAVLALARGNADVLNSYYDGYYDRVVAYVRDNISSGKLNADKSTDNARIALALTAIGEDPTSVGGHNLLTALNDLSYVKKQGSNGPIWALIALDSKNYTSSSRDALIEAILDGRTNDGGWALDGNATDVDMTAMAIQALAPYYNKSNKTVKDAVDTALAWLSTKQNSDGGFSSWGKANAESCAQVIVALSALNIDADTDSRFVKNGHSALENLLTFEQADGSFLHTLPGSDKDNNQMSSEQGTYALVAYDRFKTGKNSLYNMTDAVKRADASAQEVIDMINQIGYVDESSYTAIAEARNAYDKLSTEDQAKVTNYSTLTAAETSYKAILKQKQTDQYKALKAHYDDLLSDKTKKYGTAAKKKLASILQQAQTDMNAAESCERVTAIYEKAITDLDAVKPGDIEVTFRLIGALEATQDVDLTTDSYLPEYVTWVPTKTYALQENATVYDLFTEAMSDAGLRYIGAESNYVSTIYAPSCLGGYPLSEFTNGKKSGWMYTVNGTHPNQGLKNWTLNDNDVVVWHYVNDYSHEVADWFNDPNYPSLGNGTYYNGWLRAADISPEQYVNELLGKILKVGKNGTVEPKLTFQHIGKSVTFTFKPDTGYKVKDVKVNGKSVGAVKTYTIDKLTVSTRIEVEFADGKLPFTDVHETDWFYNDVLFVYEEGLFAGTSDTTFSPNAAMTRAMLVTVLYRLEGEPAVSGRSGFSDVTFNSYYEDAVTWAADNGIVNGTSASTFSPNANVTREQMAAILYRYAQYKKYNTAASSSLNGFTDQASVSGYATASLEWAVAEKLVNGSAGKLMPTGNATRAQVAAILHRFVENVATTK